ARGPPTTILAKSGSLTYTPDGRTAVLRLRDGEIHQIPTEEGGARKYRRLSFKTHVINIAGAGAILERSARSTRSDRELSAASLLAQRREEVDHYANAKRIRRTQYQGRELTPETEALLQFDDVPWRTRMAQAWTRWRLGHGTFERLMKDHPNEAAELNVWLLER